MALTVLETSVLHASDFIHWLDGGSAAESHRMARVEHPLVIELSDSPTDLRWLHRPGRTAFWRTSQSDLFPGRASESERTRPNVSTFPVEGRVVDPRGRFNSRRFMLTLGDGQGHAIVLYPSPAAVRFGHAGGLIGTLRRSDGEPVRWALLTVSAVTPFGETLVFRAQSNTHGDFLLPTGRLPPLPESIVDYAATLGIAADITQGGDEVADPDALPPVQIADVDSPGLFSDTLAIRLVPGEIRPLRSFGRNHLSVQAV